MARTPRSSGRLRDVLSPLAAGPEKPALRPGDIVVADPFAHALIRVIPGSGAQSVLFRDSQTLLASGGALVQPWAVAVVPG